MLSLQNKMAMVNHCIQSLEMLITVVGNNSCRVTRENFAPSELQDYYGNIGNL